MNSLLIVYNTYGLRDNSSHYIKCIDSILNCELPRGTKIVISSCFNSPQCRNTLVAYFGNKIHYCFINKQYTVNVTFNKTVQMCVKEFGEFENYLYLDSGIDFVDNKLAIISAINTIKETGCGILSFQVANDNAIGNVGITEFPLRGKNHIVPLGTACNGHAEIFSNSLFKAFNFKLIPDVFAAFCTESTFSFLVAAVGKKWIILGDYVLNHAKSIDGASSSTSHYSRIYGNPWNNLLFNRNALEFINDQEAIDAGLGYEECNHIMMHNKNSYTEDGQSKNPELLLKVINKYFYLNKEELNYDAI